MTDSAYSFLPWLRRGLAAQITAADGDPSVIVRPQVNVDLMLTGTAVGGGTVTSPLTFPVSLYGPGDVIGLDPAAVVRVEPRAGTTNVEPNYLATIEFYDEDLPWRYTPAAPDPALRRLRPWITLLVLADAEFTEGAAGGPLPSIEIVDPAPLPDPAELWAWAHVHVNASLSPSLVSTDGDAIGAALAPILAQNPDAAYARLISPRHLAANTAYTAFVVPTFEAGRRAGLGIDPSGVVATAPAWGTGTDHPDPTHMPYYYRWTFATATNGDFESLVRLLRAQPVDPRVGVRDIDVTAPAPGVSGLDNAALEGVLHLPGALQTPDRPADAWDSWDDPVPRPVQTDIAKLVNLPDDYQRAGVADPIVAPPLYGRWPALASRVLTDVGGDPLITPGTPLGAESWVQRLNLDPRWRAAAGLGVAAVTAGRETYMQAAWEQVGAVLAAARRIRLGQLGQRVTAVFHQRIGRAGASGGAPATLALLAPVTGRVRSGTVTVRHAVSAAPAVRSLLSPAARRTLRPNGSLVRAAGPVLSVSQVVTQVNARAVSVTPTRPVPVGAIIAETVAARLIAVNTPAPAARITPIPIPASQLEATATAIRGFGLDAPLTGVLRHPVNPEDMRFAAALRDSLAVHGGAQAAGVSPAPVSLDLDQLAGDALTALDPATTVVRRIRAGVTLPPGLVTELGDDGTGLVEPMAYPVIDVPMYQPLAAASVDAFLPNAALVPNNSVTMLAVNTRFIESYMVGVNHAFAAELLWREYPTDQRGTPFRQFWQVRGTADASGPPTDAQREAGRDIPPLHEWDLASALGSHDTGGAGLVVLIRGELLKRYPNTVVYAQRAAYTTGPDGSRQRGLADLPTDSPPPVDLLLTPQYEATIAPDIYLFGFALTPGQARGTRDDPGWFIVLKERPGEPRFGLDIDRAPQIQVWNDLAWPDVMPDVTPPGGNLSIAASPAAIALVAPADADKAAQYPEDIQIVWRHDTDAAALAYVLYQAPVLVAVHASQMLAA